MSNFIVHKTKSSDGRLFYSIQTDASKEKACFLGQIDCLEDKKQDAELFNQLKKLTDQINEMNAVKDSYLIRDINGNHYHVSGDYFIVEGGVLSIFKTIPPTKEKQFQERVLVSSFSSNNWVHITRE